MWSSWLVVVGFTHCGPVTLIWSTLVMVQCCQAFNQCWFLISEVRWYSHDTNYTASVQAAILKIGLRYGRWCHVSWWLIPLYWRHNGRGSVSNHQPHDCLLYCLFRRRSKKTSKPRVTALCVGNSPVTGEFPAPMASSAENASIWWRHHAVMPWKGFLSVVFPWSRPVHR